MISVVVRSKDEADRLRLTLASLRRQSGAYEVIVVDDGSSDHTMAILKAEARQQPLRIVHHAEPKGRAAASNAGAAIARGDVLLFLDGDTLAGPSFVASHAALHEQEPLATGRGEIMHLRGTRMLLDPETCSPRTEHRDAMGRRSASEIERMRVSLAQVLDSFEDIDRRAERGVYPGAGPRRLAELEEQLLGNNDPDCTIGWAAASGSNFSVNRDQFRRSGGFDERLHINEHRELALRLEKAGGRLRRVSGAKTYHLIHRSGWRDPVANTDWEAIFLGVHPEPAVALLIVFWASLSREAALASEFRIPSLEALQAAADGGDGLRYNEARRRLGAPALGAEFWAGSAKRKCSTTRLFVSA